MACTSLLIIMIFGSELTAQVQIRGIVRDAYSKQELANVNVMALGLHSGTSTDQRGKFSLSIPADGHTRLRLTHVGYRSRQIAIDNPEDEMTIFMVPEAVEIDPVTITATLNRRKVSTLPGRVAVLNEAALEQLPAHNTDDLLRGIANVYVNRPWGIFSKGASVSMRGLPGSARTLILIDGIPMNKAAGGTLNWNFIQSSDVEKIEVVKGPGSALYGNNAMGGVINLTTKKPVKPLEAGIRAFGGSMGTAGGAMQLGGSNKTNGRGFYWNTNGFYRKGDGYYIEPAETRDETDAKVNLNEYNLGVEGGYSFDSTNSAGLIYRYYDGTFGTGTQIYEEDGSYDQYRSHLLSANWSGKMGSYTFQSRVYYQRENFDRQNESISRSGKYKLSDTESLKNDLGLWINASRTFFGSHLFTAGVEVKNGDMDALQHYRTSSDIMNYGGKLFFAGIFLQDEFNITSRLSAIAGVRFDMARFYDGFQNVTNPTSNTGFIQNTSTNFSDDSWTQLSPKIALQYEFTPRLGAYISFAGGFMPPKIDDMAKSGKISKGFKLANPELKPENIFNYELGVTWMPAGRFSLEPSIYYSRGFDFQYFVATGDSVVTGGSDLKPVLQRQNVSEVEIVGAEITARWEVFTNFVLTASYARNQSEILQINNPFQEDKKLLGKSLIEVPAEEAYASIGWRNSIVNLLLDWRYTGREWYNDENTQFIPPYHVFGLKLTKTLPQGIGFSLSADNVFDNVTIDRKGMQTPGRFVIAEISYTF